MKQGIKAIAKGIKSSGSKGQPDLAYNSSYLLLQTGLQCLKDSYQNNDRYNEVIAVVNMSLAIELALTALVMLDTGKQTYKHKHDLLQIYSKCISPQIQKELNKKYVEIHNDPKNSKLPKRKFIRRTFECALQSDDFDIIDSESVSQFLDIHNNAFAKWRFIYEPGEDKIEFNFDFRAALTFYEAVALTMVDIIKGFYEKHNLPFDNVVKLKYGIEL
ncbi:MAG: hypothetical protein RH948_03110 [Cyclobacteriaceae bacterium]